MTGLVVIARSETTKQSHTNEFIHFSYEIATLPLVARNDNGVVISFHSLYSRHFGTNSSNDKLFPSLETLSEDIKAYYDILKEVNLVVWDKMYINVINTNAALVTAKFRYSFTSINNEKTDLQGWWTAFL